jgi:predicted ribosome quality control (RQC) complex YloA/Tae2 family protein
LTFDVITIRGDAHLGRENYNDGWGEFVESKFARTLEREINASNAEIERLTNKVAQLYEGAEEVKQRIKRLEEVGDELYENSYPTMWDSPTDAARKLREQNDWNKTKEAKP